MRGITLLDSNDRETVTQERTCGRGIHVANPFDLWLGPLIRQGFSLEIGVNAPRQWQFDSSFSEPALVTEFSP